MKSSRWALALVGLLAALFLVAPAPAQAAAYCGIGWGSLSKEAPGMSPAPMNNVRAGHHGCFDRIVLDLAGDAGGYRVQYVSAVHSPGSGQLVPLRGGAKLEITVFNPAYHLDTGTASYTPANPAELVNTAGLPTLRQLALAGSFEGETTLGAGVRARLPFRAFVVPGPGDGSRLVIDVAHYW